MLRSILAFGLLLCFTGQGIADVQTGNTIREASVSKPLRIVVLGDSLADGLYAGLRQLNRDRKDIKTTKKSRVNTGLVRFDRYNWNRGAAKIARSRKYDAAVVLLGLNDLQSIRERGKAHHFKTEGWEVRYKGRLDKMMRDLKASGMAVYWASIPITSPKKYQKEYAYLNSMYREAASRHGVRFVDTWRATADSKGRYTPYFTFPSGKRKIIRTRDGVHFTSKGYVVFAEIVNRALMADMMGDKQAKLSN